MTTSVSTVPNPSAGQRSPARAGRIGGPVSAAGWALSMAVADRRNVVRLVVMAVGVGLCAFALLALTTISPLVDSMNERAAASTPDMTAGAASFSSAPASVTVQGHVINGILLQANGAAPPIPPGTTEFPADGQLIVSPALAAMLADATQRTLRDVFPGPVVGDIRPAVLPGAGDLFFYQGTDHLVDGIPGNRWGVPVGEHPLDPRVWSVLVTGAVIVMVPLLLFTALAGRLGAARRDRRTATLRLLGASARRLRLLVAGEAVLAAVAGVFFAALAYLLARLVVPTVQLSGRGVQLHDVTPGVGGAVAVLIGVPVLTVAAMLTGFRSSATSPLATMHRTRRGPRATWRLALLGLAVAVACLAGYRRYSLGEISGTAIFVMCLVVALGLFAVAALVGLITDRLARCWPGGTVAGQLARRRILQDGSTTTRAAAGLATVMAGFIVLMTLLSGSRYVSVQSESSKPTTVFGTVPYLDAAEWTRLDTSISGVRAVHDVSLVSVLAGTADTVGLGVTVANCTAIRLMTTATQCGNGDSFQVEQNGVPVPSNRPLNLIFTSGQTRTWSPPTDLLRVRPNPPSDQNYFNAGGYLLTPQAAEQQFPGLLEQQRWIQVTATLPNPAIDEVQRAVTWLGPRGYGVLSLSPLTGLDASPVPWIRAGLIGSGLLTLLICALGQWLMGAEQISERRRALALARASGVSLSVLGRSVAIAAMLPVVVGVVLAGVAGTVLARLVEYLRGALWNMPTWQWTVLGGGAALAVAGLVAAGSAVRLRSATRPEGLRTE